MKGLKYNQNKIIHDGDFTIVTTMTKLEVYAGNKLVGSSGVKRESNFDYDALLKFAKHQSGSDIQVA